MNTDIRMLRRRLRLYLIMAMIISAASLMSLVALRAVAHGGEDHGPAFAVGTTTENVHLSPEARTSLGIRTMLAEERSLSSAIRVAGVVRAAPGHEAFLTSPVDGVIREIRVRPGDRIGQGHVVALVTSSELGRAQGEVFAASVEATAAGAQLRRQKYLYSRGIVSGRELDEARATLGRAEGARSGAAAAISAVDGGRIISPISGIVADRSATIGQGVTVGTSIAHIVDPSIVVVEGDVPEVQANLIREGANIKIRAEAYPEKDFEGRIRFISPVVHEDKRTIHILAEIENRETLLRPGMFVDVMMETDTSTSSVAVPVEAVVDEGAEHYVFVEQTPGEYVRARVSIGASDGVWIAVNGAIFPGDAVVVEGGRTLEMAALGGVSSKPAAKTVAAHGDDGHTH